MCQGFRNPWFFIGPARNTSGNRGNPLEDMSTYPPGTKSQGIQGVPDELQVVENAFKRCICMCVGFSGILGFWFPGPKFIGNSMHRFEDISTYPRDTQSQEIQGVPHEL